MYYMQPGVAYGLTYEGKPLGVGGMGLKDKTKTGVPDADTIFRIGSVSKVFAVSIRSACHQILLNYNYVCDILNWLFYSQTLVLYQLFDKGMVKSLDDDITNYCPDFKMQTQYNTTLRQLASQVSPFSTDRCSLESFIVTHTDVWLAT